MSDTSEMVERVAYQLFKATGTPFTHWCMNSAGRADFRQLARVAIATMREPTERMVEEGYEAGTVLNRDGDLDRFAKAWRAMIDGALRE